jgi:hypothetical protein
MLDVCQVDVPALVVAERNGLCPSRYGLRVCIGANTLCALGRMILRRRRRAS